jgi:hypothetical protein
MAIETHMELGHEYRYSTVGSFAKRLDISSVVRNNPPGFQGA